MIIQRFGLTLKYSVWTRIQHSALQLTWKMKYLREDIKVNCVIRDSMHLQELVGGDSRESRVTVFGYKKSTNLSRPETKG